MSTLATVVGFLMLAWMFVGPLVGYAIRDRGWRIRSPLARSDEEEA